MDDIRQIEPSQNDPNLLDYWWILVRHKTIIIIIVGFAFVISIIISLLLPKIYASTVSILPPQQEGSLSSGIVSQLPGGLGSIAGGFLGIKSPAGLWVGILRSEAVKGAIVKRFNLKEVYGTETIEDARNVLKSSVTIKKSREEIISVTVEDKDPEMAAKIANAFVEELDRINKGVVMSSGKRMRVFVEARLNKTKAELAMAEEAIKAFQEKNRAVKLDQQSKTIIEAIGNVKGQLMAKEVELQTFLSYATPDHPQAEILKTHIDELKERLKELEEGTKENTNPHQKDIFIPTIRMPDLSLQYARLLRDVKVQETLYELLIQQYEMARIQEAKDSPTVQVLDVAKVSQKRVKPNRRTIVILSTFTATFLAIFLAFFLEYIRKMRELWTFTHNR